MGNWELGNSAQSAAAALASFINANANFSASAILHVVKITQSAKGAAGNTGCCFDR